MLSFTMAILLTNSSSQHTDFFRQPSGVGFPHPMLEPLHPLLTHVRELTRWAGFAMVCSFLLQNFTNVTNLRWNGRKFALEWTPIRHGTDAKFAEARFGLSRESQRSLERICDFGERRDVRACQLPKAHRNGVRSAAFTFCPAYPTPSGADASNLGAVCDAVCDLVKESWL